MTTEQLIKAYQNQPQWIKTWTIERLKEMNEIEALRALGVE